MNSLERVLFQLACVNTANGLSWNFLMHSFELKTYHFVISNQRAGNSICEAAQTGSCCDAQQHAHSKPTALATEGKSLKVVQPILIQKLILKKSSKWENI